jgi:hypothetical protein
MGGPANQRSCSATARSPAPRCRGNSAARARNPSSSRVSVTDAPTRTPSPVTSKALSSGTCVAPTSTGYLAALNFISMPTSVLPTTSLAPGWRCFSASRASRVKGRCHAATGPGMASSGGERVRSSGGKIGSAEGRAGVKGPRAGPSLWALLEAITPSPSGAPPQPQGWPVDGHSFWLRGPAPLALAAPFASAPFAAAPSAAEPLAARLAAMASSV